MGFFKRNRDASISVKAGATSSSVEIEAHRDATKEAIKEAREATQKLNQLLVDNGFSLKIYLATGGRDPRKKKHGH